MINITSQVNETISLITTTESSTTTTTTNTNTISSSSSSSTSSTISLTNNNNSANNNNIDDNSIIAINCTVVTDDNLPILTHTNSANNTNISLDSDSSNSSTNPNLSRDISCIDLTEGDDDIEIINEKISFRPHKKRKREHRTPSSTSTSCCPHRPCRNSLRESSTTSNHRISPRSASRRSAHHHQPLTPPRLLPVLSLQEQLSISPPRSDSFIVDLANSPSPSTSSSSNKSNSIDILVESVPKRKNIVEIQKPQEPVRYKIVKCPICLEEDHKILAAGGEIVVTVCGHVYCKSCIQQAIKTNHCCPNCRKKLTQKNYHRIFL
ncbi:myosin-G heavy chain-like [Panonychus citri]|uniref:myosin-G heavy chain-like n=1 Tax=Panonychus citri TaxID=50023 RepID=UPI0023075470|nr:myosin-G heavy chain-like [Panonychus citri]